MQEVAIVAFAQTPCYRRYEDSEPSLVMDVVSRILEQTGIDRHRIDFTNAASCDYLSGLPFSFIANADGYGAWPPIYESHVEMDGAWALFEAFVRLQVGDIDFALVVGSGKSSPGNPREIFPLQTDPYVHAPLGLDPVSAAGLQARALIDQGKATERDFAEVVSRSRRDAMSNPNAQVAKDVAVEDLLAEPYYAEPLRKHDLPPISDGAAAVLIARDRHAREVCDKPVWIRAIDHRIESHHLSWRDLTDSPSCRQAARAIGLDSASIDVAELCVRFSPEEIVLRRALGLSDATRINPSGGPLCGHPVMASGLIRVIEVARRVREGEARRGLAHAASGPALQQNLLCLLEGDA
ncbi:MAG: lipid-transfer protein [Deltaproteobacteria bacterium]|nr:MAG: lipid-transfer protein [Deltaproteobacteria bacterium]